MPQGQSLEGVRWVISFFMLGVGLVIEQSGLLVLERPSDAFIFLWRQNDAQLINFSCLSSSVGLQSG